MLADEGRRCCFRRPCGGGRLSADLELVAFTVFHAHLVVVKPVPATGEALGTTDRAGPRVRRLRRPARAAPRTATHQQPRREEARRRREARDDHPGRLPGSTGRFKGSTQVRDVNLQGRQACRRGSRDQSSSNSRRADTTCPPSVVSCFRTSEWGVAGHRNRSLIMRLLGVYTASGHHIGHGRGLVAERGRPPLRCHRGLGQPGPGPLPGRGRGRVRAPLPASVAVTFPDRARDRGPGPGPCPAQRLHRQGRGRRPATIAWHRRDRA